MYAQKRYAEAYDFYSKAVEVSTEATENVHIFYANRAMCLLGLHRYEEALSDSNKAIELNPSYAKAYLRKAEAERELLMNDKAIETL
jgi:serine/threonine-protein phosphatase 5